MWRAKQDAAAAIAAAMPFDLGLVTLSASESQVKLETACWGDIEQ